MGDYSCNIYLRNDTEQVLALLDFDASTGTWPIGNPPNRIEPNSETNIQLKDELGTKGSGGSVKYKLCNSDATFEITFACPFAPFSENDLSTDKKQNGSFEIEIGEFNKDNHPLNGHITIHPRDTKKASKNRRACTHRVADDHVHANFDIGFDVPGVPFAKQPVHESIAIAAFIKSDVDCRFPPGTTYNNLNPEQFEFFRGVTWNDDPSVLLFDDDKDDNRKFGAGAEWFKDYQFGDPNCMTQRSHFGDLQFLHGMGGSSGEKPLDTKNHLMHWIETMYKLALGGQEISPDDLLRDRFPNFFNEKTEPKGNASIRDLLLGHTPSYKKTNVQARAFGSCLHVITDSYAVGHTQRRLMNPEWLLGRDDDGFLRFNAEIAGNWGPVICFHNYSGQDTAHHSHYDSIDADELPRPNDLNTFKRIIGANSAIESCAPLVEFYYKGTNWDDGVRQYLDEKVFVLDPEAKPANGDVDKDVVKAKASYPLKDAADDDRKYLEGMRIKLAGLEAGYASNKTVGEVQNFCEERRLRVCWGLLLGTMVWSAGLVLYSRGLAG